MEQEAHELATLRNAVEHAVKVDIQQHSEIGGWRCIILTLDDGTTVTLRAHGSEEGFAAMELDE